MADKQALKPLRVRITIDNIYLPLDEAGNCLAWEGEELNLNTSVLKRGQILLMHPDLAKSLDAADKVKLVME